MSHRITSLFLAACLLVCLSAATLLSAQSQRFTEDQLETVCRTIKAIGEDSVVDMVEKRGVDFHLTESFTRRLRKAGAGDALIAAVSKASAEHDKGVSAAPAIGSKAEKQAQQAHDQDAYVAVPPPLDDKGQKELLERARERALSFTHDLPAFICLQVTQRYGNLQEREQRSKLDTVNARLSFDAEHRENYEVISSNGMVDKKKITELGGAMSTGEFGSLLQGVFEPATHATFEWLRQTALRGRAIELYGYNVRKEYSQWQLDYNHERHTYPAYRGMVYIDRETAQVLRLSIAAVNIEKDFPIRDAQDTLDYDWVNISGYTALLPQRALMTLSDGTVSMDNEITFRMYRKFTTDTSIKFDIPEDDKEPAKPAPPPAPVKKPN